MHGRTKAAITLTVVAAGIGTAAVAVGSAPKRERSAALAARIDPSRPKNVIFFLGDGMGDAEVTLARYYDKGAAGRLNMDRLAFRGSQLHYVLQPGPGPYYLPNYSGDSAPTATAFSTGKRTIDNRLSQGPSAADDLPGSNAGFKTYMEIARDRGRSTGNVSTAEITDATPAAPSAHISQRACQGPDDARRSCPTETKAAGGLGSIAEQQVGAGFDVVLGGGRQRYLQPLEPNGTTTVLDAARAAGYAQQPTTEAGLASIRSLAGGKVLGLFSTGTMTTEFKPLYARTLAFLNANRPTVGRTPGAPDDVATQGGSPGTRCVPGQREATDEPSLPAMTQKAIDLLDDNPKGFTLQVEGASIDKRDHAADACGQIGETVAFDDAIGVAQAYQARHPDTLIVMTADHGHSSQIINANAVPAAGTAFATLRTVDGAPIRVAYGTADTGSGPTTGGSQAHTGVEVPIWASGPQAANVVGTLDETDIFSILNGRRPSRVRVPPR